MVQLLVNQMLIQATASHDHHLRPWHHTTHLLRCRQDALNASESLTASQMLAGNEEVPVAAGGLLGELRFIDGSCMVHSEIVQDHKRSQ